MGGMSKGLSYILDDFRTVLWKSVIVRYHWDFWGEKKKGRLAFTQNDPDS